MFRFTTQHLVPLSRDRRFLLRLSMGIVVMSVGLAAITSSLRQPGTVLFESIEWDDLEKLPTSDQGWIELIRFGRTLPLPTPHVDSRMILDEDSNDLILKMIGDRLETTPIIETYFRGLRRGEPDAAIEELTEVPALQKHRSEFLGDLHFMGQDFASALQFYCDEFDAYPENLYSRRSSVISAWRIPNRSEMKRLLSDQVTAKAFEDSERVQLFADARDYGNLAKAVAEFSLRSVFNPATALPFVISAAIWFVILTSFWQFDRGRALSSLIAFFLGVASSATTLFAVLLQERIYGFELVPESSPLSQFIYWVAGVGLREETIKLIFFIPVGVWAARRRSHLEALVLAGIVGLGFAFGENCISYREASASSGTWGRFLTANAIHFSLTGIVGFYFTKMVMRKFHGLEDFLAAFIAVVVVHGLYDAILGMPSLSDYSILMPIFVALVAYRYFDPLRASLDTYAVHRRISPLGVFVVGSVTLACIALIATSTTLPLGKSLGVFAGSIGSLIPLSFAYISRFRDL
ncbi:MAG: PrsW family glutamic-type intramembrane protease [Verrucomicrobiota bacterium]